MKIRTVACAVVMCLVVLGARPAFAQAQASTTIAGGYSTLREVATGITTAHNFAGWFVSVARQLGTGRLAIAGEIDSHSRKSVVDETLRLYGVLGGVRFRLTESQRIVTFAHALTGMERFSEPGFSESGLAFQPGGGADIAISKSIGLRVQANFRIAQTNGDTFKEVLVAVGAAVRF